MGMKLSFTLLAVIIVMAGGFAWYFKLTQAKIDVLIENAAVLESVTNTQKATITELQASAEKQAQQTQDLAAKLAAAETSNRKIASMLAQTDIVKNSLVDPTGVEVRINEEVDLFFNELQSLTSD